MSDAALAAALREQLPALDLREWEPMDRHTTFRIGGRAELFCRPKGTEELRTVCRILKEKGVRPFVMGRGSNLLFGDGELKGIVIQLAENQGEIERLSERELYAQSGATLVQLARTARDLGLSGLEFAGGIPGAVGGGIAMNAGAYGGEMKDVTAWVDVLDGQLELRRLTPEDCDFSYRHSAFLDGEDIILGAAFRLTPESGKVISQRMEEYKAKRVATQPLNYPSAGSTFKRPAAGIAAKMIDEAGLKGYTVGGAQVSEKHAGFVINRGGATCSDVLKLMDHVQTVVEERTGVRLEPEVRIVTELGE
ncbi:MAG: UDP-N-acetylmuramate dehydrogenase [Oscillospiraceae bacterium]|nr:UDP-N-acetylmuramate dehydrogenase [Oscillospiraceae bacterium]